MTETKPQNKWWLAGLRGLAAIILGAFLILSPNSTLMLLLMVFSVYLMVDGIVRLIGVYRKHYETRRLFHQILGITGIVTGIVVVGARLLNIEIDSTFQMILGVLIGVQAVIGGILMLVSSRKQSGARQGVTFFGGIGAIALGIVTVISVLSNDISLVPIIGIIASAYGGIYLYLAYTAYQSLVDKATHP